MEKSIFRAYDVRGIYNKTITDRDMEVIGNSLARVLKESKVVAARDPRLSSGNLSKAFIRGFAKTGKGVVDVGMVPLGTGSLYAWKGKLPFAYITGSHLSKEWNGIKFFHKNGIGFLEEDNSRVRDLSLEEKMLEKGRGRVERKDTDEVLGEYVDFLLSKIKPEKRLKVVLDCGNGAAGVVARKLFEKAGFEVDVVFEEPDGRFPNRSPDNFEDPLKEARKRVREADFGIAYDGDGDRGVIIKNNGEALTPEQTAYVILGELLEKEKGPVVANVECTRVIDDIAEKFGREVRRVRVGHTFLMDGVQRFRASFGVERSGHYVIPSIFSTDDTLAVSYYFACVLSRKEDGLSDIVRKIPDFPFHRVNLDCDDEKKFLIIDKIKQKMRSEYSKINTMDGIRLDMDEGWVLMRPSNTSPVIRVTIEGKDNASLQNLKDKFLNMVKEEIKSFG